MKKRVFIIAEAGVNHNNKINLAFKLVDAAKSSGADAIKFQVFKTENYVSRKAPLAKYQKKNSNKSNQFDMIKNLELSETNLKKIMHYCKKKKIIFLASPFDQWGLSFLIRNNVKIIKIPSGEINNIFFLKKISQYKKNVILSTGMSKMTEVKRAVNILISSKIKKSQITILQCNSEYPTPIKDLNLNVLKTFKEKFNLKIGLSDHTKSIYPPIVAVSLGAKVIEKHLTLNTNSPGPDHKASVNPKDFKLMSKLIRLTESSLGSYEKKPSKSETKNIKIARKSVFALRTIKRGDKFSTKNICLKRPAFGIQAENFEKLLGKRSKKDYLEDQIINSNEL